ncbi:hypothetical protein AURDEDRAFT_116642 [Auricularia subglabra TFB-10046 SS5]|uniref:Uncharacterized protein n=1 Tax=Auricularia subglabra (strain TFB-10046 / SS5) TaxID=717982 RepID=J0WWT0_AURST|nr:hypothetical protein AURDEDRAFT_116642 [Auricularia subglabra TFB-10046 SS5]
MIFLWPPVLVDGQHRLDARVRLQELFGGMEYMRYTVEARALEAPDPAVAKEIVNLLQL